jgi:TonB family protein
MEISVNAINSDGLTAASTSEPVPLAHSFGLSVQAAVGPKVLDGRGLQGRVLVVYSLSSDGTLLGARVSKSSGHDELDSQALKIVNAANFPTPPSSLSAVSRRYASAFTFV